MTEKATTPAEALELIASCKSTYPGDVVSLGKAALPAAQEQEALVRELVELLEEAQSGFIPGCGLDMKWTEKRDATLARAKEAGYE